MVEYSPESLSDGEISRGKLIKAARGGYTERTFDILASFLDVLGKKVSDLPPNYERAELLIDTAMDLETNASKGFTRRNTSFLKKGQVSRTATDKTAQPSAPATNH